MIRNAHHILHIYLPIQNAYHMLHIYVPIPCDLSQLLYMLQVIIFTHVEWLALSDLTVWSIYYSRMIRMIWSSIPKTSQHQSIPLPLERSSWITPVHLCTSAIDTWMWWHWFFCRLDRWFGELSHAGMDKSFFFVLLDSYSRLQFTLNSRYAALSRTISHIHVYVPRLML